MNLTNYIQIQTLDHLVILALTFQMFKVQPILKPTFRKAHVYVPPDLHLNNIDFSRDCNINFLYVLLILM